MNSRAWLFALTRRGVIFPAAIGAFLLAVDGPETLIAIAGVIAFWRFLRILSTPDLGERLRLRAEKENCGIHRKLSDGEQQEIIALSRYRDAMILAGASKEVADNVMRCGWQTVADHQFGDAAEEMRRFRLRLPSLAPSEARAPGKVVELVERELALLNAARREVEFTASVS